MKAVRGAGSSRGALGRRLAAVATVALASGAVAAVQSSTVKGAQPFTTPLGELPIAFVETWVLWACIAFVGVAAGVIVSGIVGPVPKRLTWVPLATLALGLVPGTQALAYALALHGNPVMMTRSFFYGYFLVSNAIPVMCAVIAARLFVGLEEPKAILVGLCLAWWVVGGIRTPSTAFGLVTLYGMHGLVGVAIASITIVLSTTGSIELAARLLQRRAPGQSEEHRGSGAYEAIPSGWLRTTYAVALAGLAIATARLASISTVIGSTNEEVERPPTGPAQGKRMTSGICCSQGTAIG